MSRILLAAHSVLLAVAAVPLSLSGCDDATGHIDQDPFLSADDFQLSGFLLLDPVAGFPGTIWIDVPPYGAMFYDVVAGPEPSTLEMVEGTLKKKVFWHTTRRIPFPLPLVHELGTTLRVADDATVYITKPFFIRPETRVIPVHIRTAVNPDWSVTYLMQKYFTLGQAMQLFDNRFTMSVAPANTADTTFSVDDIYAQCGTRRLAFRIASFDVWDLPDGVTTSMASAPDGVVCHLPASIAGGDPEMEMSKRIHGVTLVLCPFLKAGVAWDNANIGGFTDLDGAVYVSWADGGATGQTLDYSTATGEPQSTGSFEQTLLALASPEARDYDPRQAYVMGQKMVEAVAHEIGHQLLGPGHVDDSGAPFSPDNLMCSKLPGCSSFGHELTVEQCDEVWKSAGGRFSNMASHECDRVETDCRDAADNDCDGRADCFDPNCKDLPRCSEQYACDQGSSYQVKKMACPTGPGTSQYDLVLANPGLNSRYCVLDGEGGFEFPDLPGPERWGVFRALTSTHVTITAYNGAVPIVIDALPVCAGDACTDLDSVCGAPCTGSLEGGDMSGCPVGGSAAWDCQEGRCTAPGCSCQTDCLLLNGCYTTECPDQKHTMATAEDGPSNVEFDAVAGQVYFVAIETKAPLDPPTETVRVSVACGVPEVCDDGRDNDGDGLVDCCDSDCHKSGALCHETCDNGADDDCDAKVDCCDMECKAFPACAEVCGDGLDADCDGLPDCLDPDCLGMPPVAEQCGNGLDDDCDNYIDCADDDCWFAPACSCKADDTWACGVTIEVFTPFVDPSDYTDALVTYPECLPTDSIWPDHELAFLIEPPGNVKSLAITCSHFDSNALTILDNGDQCLPGFCIRGANKSAIHCDGSTPVVSWPTEPGHKYAVVLERQADDAGKYDALTLRCYY